MVVSTVLRQVFYMIDFFACCSAQQPAHVEVFAVMGVPVSAYVQVQQLTFDSLLRASSMQHVVMSGRCLNARRVTSMNAMHKPPCQVSSNAPHLFRYLIICWFQVDIPKPGMFGAKKLRAKTNSLPAFHLSPLYCEASFP
jgi:hypothetical protein